MAAGQAKLTSWEEQQLTTIEMFFKQAKEAMDYFASKKAQLRETDGSGLEDSPQDWLKFRSIVIDLYSVLDYTWYLLYCHFSNSGHPDLSDKCIKLGFPHKKCVKSSETPEHDQRKKFLKEKLTPIWGDKIGEDTHFWREIAETILSVQRKLNVDSSGAHIGEVLTQPGDGESFALLHFYRNCAAHRDLIKFMPKRSWVQINQITRETKVVSEKQDDQDGYFYRQLERGYWIGVPGSSDHPTRDTSRLLMDVLQQLMQFVVKMASRLLWSALLLPPAKVILESHLKECKVEQPYVKVTQTHHQAEVTVTLASGKKLVKSAEGDNEMHAKKQACVSMLKSLVLREGIHPKSPYSFFTPHYVCLFPEPQAVLREPDQTCQEVLKKFQDQLETKNMKVKMEYEEQHGDTVALKFLVRTSIGKVFFIRKQVKSLMNTSGVEEAAMKVVGESIRLGLLDRQEIEWPFEPQMLSKTGNKTYRMVLNEFGQKMEKVNMVVEGSFCEPVPLEGQRHRFETELTLAITSKKDKIVVHRFSSGKQRGLGKNSAKEEAAKVILQKCIDAKLIELKN